MINEVKLNFRLFRGKCTIIVNFSGLRTKAKNVIVSHDQQPSRPFRKHLNTKKNN